MPDPDLTTLPVLTSPDELEAWLETNGATATEHWVRFHKKTSPQYRVDLPQLVEVALMFGWIDVKGRRVDDQTRAIRFTPRRPKSNWSEINRAVAKRLIAAGKMRPSGFASLPADFE
ncbi:MAG: hypothetical protein KC438_08065 [Thermomicrobiales bacterium]|nr:hypothetical protein [Thermomicrobiales bacterium]MCO5221299.1 hypothetical protein [Thermomicrobiales bacterium]